MFRKCFLKKRIILLAIVVILCFIFVLKWGVEYRVQLSGLTPSNIIVNEERFNKDISRILSLYGLKQEPIGDVHFMAQYY